MIEGNLPLISIIVPIYNIEKYLPECIESIIHQTYDNYELILVDDGSTDNSASICDDYKNNNKIVVLHKPNGGLVSARKAGCEIARGDYITCVDGDDWIDEKYVEIITEEIIKNQPDIVCFEYKKLTNTKSTYVRNMFSGVFVREDIEKKIFPMLIQTQDAKYFNVSIWSKAYKSKLYKNIQIGVNDEIRIGEDAAVLIPAIYYSSKISFVNSNIYNYRINESSMTHKAKPFAYDGPILLSKHIENNIDTSDYDFREQINRKIVHDLFSVMISIIRSNKSYINFLKEASDILDNQVYSKIIKNAHFSNNIKATIMHWSMKYRLFFLIYCWGRIK